MKFLSDEQWRELQPAETSSFPSPVPTQIVSSDEYLPVPQTEKQREVEIRLKELSNRLARRQSVSRVPLNDSIVSIIHHELLPCQTTASDCFI